MITCLSKYVSRFLCNKHIINSDEVDIYQYGFEIIISTVAGMIISLVVGVIFQLFYISLVYYTIFVTVRQFTGGYHAKTYLECNIVFSIVSFSTIGLTKLILKLSIYHIDPIYNSYLTVTDEVALRHHGGQLHLTSNPGSSIVESYGYNVYKG